MCLHWYTSLLVFCVIRESSSCSFGNDLNQLTSSTTTGFILNNANPSQCPGNATRWNMCYYSSGNSNAAYLAVYRPSGTQYSLVSGSSSNYSVSPIMSGYNCSHFSIPQSQRFVVQQGDVIAACVKPSSSGRVGIVATANGSLRAQLYTRPIPIICGSPLPSTIQQSRLTSMSITLHVSLDINECAVNNGGCNQTCVDTTVGYNCSCFSGFQLASDMKNCTELATATTMSSVATMATDAAVSPVAITTTATTTVTVSTNEFEVQQSSVTLPDSIVITIAVIVATVVIVTAMVSAIAVSIALLRRKHTSTKLTPINAAIVTADCGNIMVGENEAYQSKEKAMTQLNEAYGRCTHKDFAMNAEDIYI